MKRPFIIAGPAFAFALVSASLSGIAQKVDRLPMMTAIFDDAEASLRLAATCRMSSPNIFSEKALREMKDSLTVAGLSPEQVNTLMARLDNIKPLLADDRPIAEALVLCHDAKRDPSGGGKDALALIDRLAVAKTLPPGRDDAQIVPLMKEVLAALNDSSVCVVLDSGPLAKRTRIEPESAYGKELRRFDISQPVRDYLDTLWVNSLDLSAYKDIGALRAHCLARSKALAESVKSKKKLPLSPFEKLKALQPRP